MPEAFMAGRVAGIESETTGINKVTKPLSGGQRTLAVLKDRIPGQPVSRPTRWSGIGPGSRPLLFATVVAAIYATVILLVASVGLVFNTDDGGSWAELVGAVVGNFILVWVVMVGLSLVVRLFRHKD